MPQEFGICVHNICLQVSCKLFICNEGFFEPGSHPRPFHARPTFLTDSKALGGYLMQDRFRAEGSMEDDCLHIRIYDVLKKDDDM